MNVLLSISPILWNNRDEMQARLPFAAFISDEANAALSVKRDEPILAILGNPPYKQHSANPSRVGRNLTFIGELMGGLQSGRWRTAR